MKDNTEQPRGISVKAFIAVIGVLLTMMSLAWGIGSRVIGDRLTIESEVIQTRSDVQHIREDVAEMREAFKALAKNSGRLDVLDQRVDEHDRRIDRLEAER